MVGHAVARVDRCQPAREITLAPHGEGRPPDPGDEGEQCAEAGDHRTHDHDRRRPGCTDLLDGSHEGVALAASASGPSASSAVEATIA